VARDRALDEQQAASDVRADDLEVLLGAVAGAHVAGHLLVLENAARILALPVEPCERCETETPWVARRPPKPQRFIAPWKPLPWVTPETSTIWPATK
jgi:hypothetical protein